MNALTKVFVVLLVIFSITFTMMTLQFSTSVPDWRGEAMKWKAEAQTVDTHNRNLIAAKVADAGRAAADRRAWSKERDDLTSQFQGVRTDLDGVKARLAKAEADTSFKDATIKKLAAELGVAQTSAEKAREHRAILEVTNIDLENRNRDLNDALNERITTIIVLEQKARQQDQAINLLRQERDNVAANRLRRGSTWLEDSTVTMPIDKVTAAARQVVTPIRGRITQVAGANASISLGSDDGVHQGMVFIIYSRQGGYLGDLIISNVEPDGAAGLLKNVVDRIGVGSLVVDEKGYVASN